ncbi:hypothetical protein [Azonexus hydrophilus]|uniref:hypothetical protein n=1 Tax=Azonexus hydrophilus TaxID=418702 RepID=UPI002492D28D|nr:hypothetical protein [Azonexus hydrophilus]
MFGLSLLRRMPAALTASLFYYGLPVLLVLRFLTGTVWEVFLLSALLYWMSWLVGDSKPLTPGQLLVWIDGLPTESKTAVITSLLTILGFLVAFHTATLNWKAEALAHLKAHVAGEIESFFTEASRLTTDAQIYVRSLIDAVNSVQVDGPTFDAMFKIQRTLEQLPKFLATRDRLSAMSVEVHGIAGRHYLLLSTVWGATKVLEDSAAAFSEITNKMWVRLPNIQNGHPDPVAEYLRQINVSECAAFVTCCEKNYDFINGATGGLRGSLLAPLVGFNFSSVLSLSGKRSTFVDALVKVREVRKGGG